MNPGDAARRGIADHDFAEFRNDVGVFVARVKLTPGMRPEQVHIYHAWMADQFLTGRSNDSVSASPVKVTQFAGKHGHLQNEVGWYEFTGNDRDTRVEMKKYVA